MTLQEIRFVAERTGTRGADAPLLRGRFSGCCERVSEQPGRGVRADVRRGPDPPRIKGPPLTSFERCRAFGFRIEAGADRSSNCRRHREAECMQAPATLAGRTNTSEKYAASKLEGV